MTRIYSDPVRRVTNHWAEVFFLPCLTVPFWACQCCFPEEKRCAETEQTNQKRNDRPNGKTLAVLLPPARSGMF